MIHSRFDENGRQIVTLHGHNLKVLGKSFGPYIKSGKGLSGAMLSTLDGERVLCHECGGLFKHVGIHIVRKHGIGARAYKDKHSLLMRQSLLAPTLRRQWRVNCAINFKGKAGKPDSKSAAHLGVQARQKMGYVNSKGICPTQIHFRLLVAAARKKKSVAQLTIRDTPRDLVDAMQHRWGSFNKGKRHLFAVDGNPQHRGIRWSKDGALEALVAWFKATGEFPHARDMTKANRLPSLSTLHTVGIGTLNSAKQRLGWPVVKSG